MHERDVALNVTHSFRKKWDDDYGGILIIVSTVLLLDHISFYYQLECLTSLLKYHVKAS